MNFALPQDELAAVVAAATAAEPAEALARLSLARLRCHVPSLTRKDGAIFLAVDAGETPLLLQIGAAAGGWGLQAPVSSGGVHAYPFGPSDGENIRAFAERIEPAFLPRPQRAQPAVAAGNRHPEISLPAVFQAFREILDETGLNVASTVQLSATREMTTEAVLGARDGEDPTAPGHTRVSIRHLYEAGLWAAIRSGFRHGYTAEADHLIVGGSDEGEIARSLERAKEAIRHAAGYTKFTTDTSRLFDLRADVRHPSPWSDAEIEELFAARLTDDERRWVLDEFARVYRFDAREIRRLAVKFGPSLRLNEELFDTIRATRAGRPFDFEPSLDEADTLTTPHELIFYMHWLRERGRPAQLVPPNLGFKKRQAYPKNLEALRRYAHHKMWPELLPRVERDFKGQPLEELRERVRELAEVARSFDGTLSIHSGSGKQAAVLESIGAATGGRVNYKISGELQLQLFDVLSEQPARSAERRLFERMVERCEAFAARGAFGEESGLAAEYRASGHGAYLGDAARGRVDGNLFLVFWLGNLVGSRDEDGVFFKEKLDRLPGEVIAETRRRNRAYVKWLATNLFSL